MKRGTADHVKFHRLKAALQIPKYQAVGILESLWHLASTQAKRGDVGKWSDEEIATWIEWPGDSAVLIATLVDTGWLDRCGKHRLIIHDWATHCDQTVKRSQEVQAFGLIEKPEPLKASGDNTNDAMLADASKMLANARQPTPLPLPSPTPKPAPEPNGAGAGKLSDRVKEIAFSIFGASIPKFNIADAVHLHSEPVVYKAMKEAEGKARAWGYIEAILQRWAREGVPADTAPVKDAAQAESAEETKWKAKLDNLAFHVRRKEVTKLCSAGGASSGKKVYVGLRKGSDKYLETWHRAGGERMDLGWRRLREEQFEKYDGPMPTRTSRLPTRDKEHAEEVQRQVAAREIAKRGGPRAVAELDAELAKRERARRAELQAQKTAMQEGSDEVRV